jgi:outer membrane receptor for ferrienterochelin and colicin
VRSLLVFVVLAGLADQVLAQSGRGLDLANATLEDLMAIEITPASRSAEGLAGAPARVQVITADQIERRGYRSLLDVLKDLVDFKVDVAGDPDYPVQLTVQGTSGSSRLVLLLDGIRVSSPTNEPLPVMANYPVHNARQIEILYGPASALYGADAFSAVINIISKSVTEAPGLAVTSSIGQFGLYNQTASYGARIGARASLMVSGQFLHDRQPDLSRSYPDLLGDMQQLRTGVFNTIYGPVTSSHPLSPGYATPISAHSVQAHLQHGGLGLSLFENRQRASTTPPNTPDNAVYNADVFAENRQLVAAGVYSRSFGGFTSTSTLMFSRHELQPQSGYRNLFTGLDRSFKYAYGSMTKVEQQLAWLPKSSLAITTGGTFERFFSIPQGADLNAPITTREQAGTIFGTDIVDEFFKLRYTNTGVYVQARYAATPRVTFTLGTRGDYNSRYGGTFNPRLGVVARVGPAATLKVLYGTAFLAPSPFQAYSHYGSFSSNDGGLTYSSSYWHLPNPDLEPQEKRTIEVSLLQPLGHDFQFSASMFYSRFSNLIRIYDPDGLVGSQYLGWPVDYVDTTINEGRAVTYGATFNLDYLHRFGPTRRVEVHADAALANGRDWPRDDVPDASVPIGAMTPMRLWFGVDVDWDRWRLAPRLSVVGSQRVLATTGAADALARRTLPGYATVDVNLRRNLYKTFDAFVTIENALDRRYVNVNPYAYTNQQELIGQPQNPRRVTVGFTLRSW